MVKRALWIRGASPFVHGLVVSGECFLVVRRQRSRPAADTQVHIEPEAAPCQCQGAFCDLDVLTDHWDRPGWTPGRRSYHWFITLGNQPALIDLAQRCQQALASFELDPVAPESLHLTLCRVGFTDEVTEEQARSVAEAARQRVRALGPFQLTVRQTDGGAVPNVNFKDAIKDKR